MRTNQTLDGRTARVSGMIMATVFMATLSARAPAQQDVITTVAGGGPNGLPALKADLGYPYEEAIDAAGNIYVADSYKNQVFKIGTNRVLTLVAGNGVAGYGGDGKAAVAAQLNYPTAVAVDGATPANIYIADYSNCLVRRVDAATGVITTIAGVVITPTLGNPYSVCGYNGNGGPANKAELGGPFAIAVNPTTHDLYIAERNNGVVRKVAGGAATGIITLLAGSGGSSTAGNDCGGSAPYGDGAAATSAYICYPQGLALDTSVTPANVFISDYNCAVREVVGATGDIYRVAGNYTCGFSDDVAATSGELEPPYQLHVAVSGSTSTIAVADYSNVRIRQFTLTYAAHVPKSGEISTIAGGAGGGFCGDGGPALSACLYPVGIVYDASGNFYIGDYANNRVREVSKSTGYISTIAGWSSYLYSDPVGLGSVPATALGLNQPTVVFADPASSTVYAGGYATQTIYAFDSATGVATTFAGNGTAGFAGDGTAADSPGTELYYPWGIAKDSAGNVYIGDSSNCVVREVKASTGDITTIAGGTMGVENGCGWTGDGAAASKAQLDGPSGMVVDANGNLYIADQYNCVVRKIVLSTGIISTVAGSGPSHCGFGGDGGPATSAYLNRPVAVAVDGLGDLFIADFNNYRVREVDAFGTIMTVAGNGASGFSGDGGAVDNAIYGPAGVAEDPNGNLFISDEYNSILRWVDPAGTMVTFAGTPSSPGFAGDGGPATSASLFYPEQISVDSGENIYVADYQNGRIRKVASFAGYGRSTDRLFFEKQQLGTTSAAQPITLSALGAVTIKSISVSSGYSEIDDCAGTTLAAGQTCEIDVSFSPSKLGITDGVVTIGSNAFFANQGSTVELVGEGGGLGISGSLEFPTQIINATSSKTVTLTNTGATASTIKAIYLTSTKSFKISSSSTCPIGGGKLNAAANCTIVVSFDAATVGKQEATLVVASSDASSPLLTAATGTATQLTVSPTALAFGSVKTNGTATLDLTVTNSSGALTLAPAIAGVGFTVLTTGYTCGAALGAGAKCTLPVQFAPTAVKAYSGTLTLDSKLTGSPTVTLSGSGIAP